MTVIFNNNAWNPVPWGWGQCSGNCGGNNALTNMFGYMMMFGMMNNIFRNNFAPQQQVTQQYPYNPYPGLYLSGAGGAGGATAANGMSYQDYVKQNEETQMYNNLKSSWPEFNFSKMGDTYYAYLKDDKTVHVESSTLDGLLGKINEYVAANPDKFRKAESTTGSSGSGSADGAGSTTPSDDSGSTVDGSGGSSSSGGSGSASGAGDTYPKGWRTINSNDYSKIKTVDSFLTSIHFVVDSDKTGVAYSTQRMSNEQKEQLKAHIIKHNPSVFDKNGNVKTDAKWDKCEIPDGATVRDNYGALPYYNSSKWIKLTNAELNREVKSKLAKPSAREFVDYMADTKKYSGYSSLTDSEREVLVTKLIELNPHCFKTDGSCNESTFNYDTLVYPTSKEVSATYAKTKKAETTKTDNTRRYKDSAKATYNENGFGYVNDITIRYGKGGKVNMITPSGTAAYDAIIEPKNGHRYYFIADDGDKINITKFNVCDGRVTCNCTVAKIKDDSSGKEYPVTMDGKKINVKYNGTTITLEEFAALANEKDIK